MNLVKKIDEMIEERSLLKHPFYQSWSDGKLTKESLAGYSKEYFQLVKAVPTFMAPIIEKAPDGVVNELIENQQEESDHIQPWIAFAGELGISEDELTAYTGLPKTLRAVSELNKLMNTYEGGACAMYAFEKEIPKISQTKLDGLAEFYGLTNHEATEYFKLHTEADIRHAAAWRNILEKSSTDSNNLIEIADKSLSAQNLLLDSCFEEYC
ncbi:MAG TPA: iron-containing redox enzyme family protein [Nitrosopumilus sp.]|jgi:pyrroloquinoline-quinone synthase|nr:pyrroloquinoline quinone biosynthesis protein PqqC [Nitrososphaerota archaeon]MDP6327132.1 iron-containing redox enzyme family protein [Nitrosopumilus sp.]HJL67403.1 iron-containing redox enzyme family protein [Nitrosopumilus sp.]HJM25659.1 iron-containing redox enzyme family protein [Nitrosopumilus sp.]HJO31336.1 iron-containing redox enzyme family protein [Nitrosopumilus sp.]|tara:strand:- start:8876 stop:9508 length:633 start_codon:yes stop_codon:yes gene_type:complete